MNRNRFDTNFVEAFMKATDLYKLTDAEKKFAFRVFVRFSTLTREARAQMMKIFGHFPQTEEERITAAMWLCTYYAKPIKEELLIGIHNYERQDLILMALRRVVVLSFPPGIIDYILNALGE